MSEASLQILCNDCKVPPEPVPDSQPETWRCPECGVSDTRENVVGEANQHAMEVVARYQQNGIRKAVRGSSVLKFSGKTIPHGQYRFITDLKL